MEGTIAELLLVTYATGAILIFGVLVMAYIQLERNCYYRRNFIEDFHTALGIVGAAAVWPVFLLVLLLFYPTKTKNF